MLKKVCVTQCGCRTLLFSVNVALDEFSHNNNVLALCSRVSVSQSSGKRWSASLNRLNCLHA